MKPICVKCRRFFRMKRSGFYFIEGMPTGIIKALPGNAEPENWKPYKIWAGDKWECPECETEIIVGFGAQPISEHYKEDFSEKVQMLRADQFQVNDC